MLTRTRFVLFGLACGAGLLLPFCAQSAQKAERLKLDAYRSLGAPRTFRNLTLTPVYDSRATARNDYITLDEGLKSGAVKVKESPTGGEVNTLYISNLGKRPLYLMAGEVVLGGQQDRTVGSDLVIAAGKKQLPITVFCVEHGRWTGQGQFDTSAKMVASASIRADAQAGALAYAAPAGPAGPTGAAGAPGRALGGYAGQMPAINSGGVMRPAPAARPVQQAQQIAGRVALSEAQEKVWDKVAMKNRRFNANPESGTYRVVLNMANGDAQRSVAPYIKALSSSIGDDPHQVGVVAAINGKVVASDIFGNTTLFRKLWPKLLRSYAADAAENATARAGNRQQVTARDAKAFLVQAASGKSLAATRSRTGVVAQRVSKQTVLYSLVPAGSGRFGGGLSLHENALSK